MAEYRRADRPTEKPYEKNGKRLEHADQRIRLREEKLAENQAGHLTVKQEIVPFDCRADRAGDQSTPHLPVVLGLGEAACGNFGCRHRVPPQGCQAYKELPVVVLPALMREAFPHALMLSEGKINIKQPAGPEAHKETSAPTRPHTDATPVARSAPMRLEGKVAVIVGAGQSPGEGIGNGRATTLRFAQEGARILAVDRLIASAEETAAMATQGGECVPFAADVTKEETLAAAMEAARARWGRIDILHNNVGVSIGGGDKPLDELSEEAFDRVCAINLRGTIMACKHVLPIMRLQRSGAIINISSVAARENSYPLVTYKATKAAMIAFTEQLALQNAPYGIRANCILPGLMGTPMAVDTRARASNRSRAEVAAERDAKVPLRGRMGTAWDVANAALFLASDEANFITGVALPVDGGALVRVG